MVVGGRVDALGSNARLGTTQYLVAEADESDRSFLKLSPILAVVTNLDREHMDCYRDMADVERAFLDFMDKVPFYGAVIACVDNPLLAAILPRARRRVLTYGVAAEADYRLEFLEAGPGALRASWCIPRTGRWGPLSCTCRDATMCSTRRPPWPSRTSLRFPPEKIAEGLNHFRGVDRRFQIARRGARRDRGGRLRPPSHGDSRHAGRGARVRPPADSRGFPAASLHPHRRTCWTSSAALSRMRTR